MNKYKFFLVLLGCVSSIQIMGNDVSQASRPAKILKYLKKVTLTEHHSGIEGVDSIYVINLDERPEKWERVKSEFIAQKLKINRFSAINGWKLKEWQKLHLSGKHHVRLSGGEVGCFLSHVSIYKDAVERDFNVVWICEDDLVFTQNADLLAERLHELSKIDPDWDLFYTDYTNHGTGCQNPRPYQSPYQVQHEQVADDIIRIHGRHCLHSVLFSKNGLRKVLEYFTRVDLWSPLDVDIHYIEGLREYSVLKDIVTSEKKQVISDTSIGSQLNSGR